MRYILIDSESGYIWADSADHRGRIFEGSALEFAEAVDVDVNGKPGSDYEMHDVKPQGADGFFVYQAHVNGSDAVPVVWDGQDQETIDAVERSCDLIGFVTRAV